MFSKVEIQSPRTDELRPENGVGGFPIRPNGVNSGMHICTIRDVWVISCAAKAHKTIKFTARRQSDVV